jgi:O-antigen/teichoic acid export membrane protein
MLSPVLRSAAFWNIGAGLFSFGLSNVASLVAMPLVVRALGDSEWPIVAACLTLQTFVAFAEAGLAQLVPREVARARGDSNHLRAMVRTAARTYAIVGGSVFVLLFAGAGMLAAHWFQAPEASVATLATAIRIFAVQALLQINNGVNVGVWYGLDMHRTAATRASIFALVRPAVGLLTISAIDGSAMAYLWAGALVSLVECVSNRREVNRSLGTFKAESLLPAEPLEGSARGLRGAHVVTAAVLVGLVASQSDRLILGRTASLGDLGVYAVAAAIGSALLGMQQPVVRVFLPRLTREAATGGQASRRALGAMFLAMFVVGVLPAVTLIALAREVLQMFFTDAAAITAGIAAMRLLLVGVIVAAPLSCAYAILIAHGRYGFMFFLNLVGASAVVSVLMASEDLSNIKIGGWMWISNGLSRLLVVGVVLPWIMGKLARNSEQGASIDGHSR